MLKFFTAVLSSVFLAACASTLAPEQQIEDILPEPSLEKIASHVWIHKSYKIVEPWGPVLSQGLVIETDSGVILVDTAWTDADTESLLGLIKDETGELPETAVVTHAHADKMGGMDALHERGVRTIAHQFSNEDAPARGLTPAKEGLALEVQGGEISITTHRANDHYETFYPGPGHTRDNIVFYYQPAKVLFGGCLIRPGESNHLGNTADGDVGHWAQAVRNVAEAFPEAEIVIPSHGPMGGRELLDHTIALAEQAAAAQ